MNLLDEFHTAPGKIYALSTVYVSTLSLRSAGLCLQQFRKKSREICRAIGHFWVGALTTDLLMRLLKCLVGSLSVLVVSIVKRRRLNEQARPLFQLALADSLAAGLLLCTAAVNFIGAQWRPRNIQMCELGIPLSLTFYCISFLLVMVYAYESQRAIRGWRERLDYGEDWQMQRGRRLDVLLLYTAVWLVPLAMYYFYIVTAGLTPADIVSNSSDATPNGGAGESHAFYCSSCILLLHWGNDTCSHVDPAHDIFEKSVFSLTVLSMLICCTVVYCKVSSWHRRYEEQGLFPVEGDGFHRRHLRSLFTTVRSMVLVVIFCWTPAFVLVSLSLVRTVSQEKIFPLYVIQALTVSLQGFLDSVVYGWLRRNFREVALAEQVPLLDGTSKPFYDESLTVSP